nr:hypothetical protein BaRGS_010698 [Batillaria attramentaria]
MSDMVQATLLPLTCHSQHSCHPDTTDQDTRMEPQLLPLEIQEGVSVRFQSSLIGRNWILPIMPFEVDEEGFRCQLTSVFPFFPTVNNSGDVMARCELGLRLKVMVKPDMRDNYTCHCHPGFKGRDCSTKGETTFVPTQGACGSIVCVCVTVSVVCVFGCLPVCAGHYTK